MSLRKSGMAGVKWTGISGVATTTLHFVQLAILARILSPADFGLMAMIMVIVGFAQAFADMGISNAIIYRRDVNSQQLSSLYWINVVASAAVFFIILLTIPLVVWLYSDARLQVIMPWAAIIFLLIPWGQQHQILLQKELKFKAISLVEMVSGLLGTVVAVTAAVNQLGVLSLIFGQLATALVRSVLFMAVGTRVWSPQYHFAWRDLDGFLTFGLFQMGERTINYFNSRVDQLLIGSLVGAQALGYFNLAFNLALQPTTRINPIITRVAFPVFASMQTDNERLKRGYLLILKILSMINFPLMMGLAVIAPTFIPLVFGAQWHDAVILVQILSLVGLLRSTGSPVGSLLMAKGRADLGFKWNLGIFFVQIPGIFVGGYYGGVYGIAIAVLVLQAGYFVLTYLVLIRKLIGSCLVDYCNSLVPNAVSAVAMAGLVLMLPKVIGGELAVMTVTQIFAGAAIYVLLCFMFQKNFLKELKDLIFSRST
jgi:lipopolysaccharide exporter